MEAAKKYFSANPEATECFVALGFAYPSFDEAEKSTLATTGKVQRWLKRDLEIVPDNENDTKDTLLKEKTDQISKLEKQLSDANELINRLGGPEKENKTIKKLQEEIKDLKELVKMYELEAVKNPTPNLGPGIITKQKGPEEKPQ